MPVKYACHRVSLSMSCPLWPFPDVGDNSDPLLWVKNVTSISECCSGSENLWHGRWTLNMHLRPSPTETIACTSSYIRAGLERSNQFIHSPM